MARLMSGGRDDMVVRMFGTMSRETTEYIRSGIDSLVDRYGDGVRAFQERVKNNFERLASRDIRIAKNNLEYVGSMFERGVRRLRTVNDFRRASRINQTYMLSHPYFANEYEKGRIEGWGYEEDRFPSLKGESNPYYQKIMNGLLQYSDERIDGEEGEEIIELFFSDELDELGELEPNEAFIVQNNWLKLYNLLNQHNEDGETEDPTSIHGAYL